LNGWLTSTHETIFTTNGNRIVITTSSSSDNPSVSTNGYTVYDWLGNTVSNITDFITEPQGAILPPDNFGLLAAGVPADPLTRPPYSSATTKFTLVIHHIEPHHPHRQSEGRMNQTNYVHHFNKVLHCTYGMHTESIRKYIGNYIYNLTGTDTPERLYGMDINLKLYIKRVGQKKFAWKMDVSLKNIVTCGCCKEGDKCKTFKKIPDKHEITFLPLEILP